MTWTKVYKMPLGIGMCVTALGLLWPLLVSLFLHDVLSTSASGTHKHSHLVLTKELVLRSTALCSAFAFYSFSIQVRGLIGEFGLHPITQSLETIKEYVESLHSSPSSTSPEGDNDEEPEEKEDHSSTTSVSGSRRSQTSSKSSKSTAKGSSLLFQHLSWQMFTSVDHFRAFMLSLVYEKCYAEKDITDHLQSITYVDTGVAVMAVVYPHPVLFCYLFLSYYAYKRVSGPFLNFQWDVLLLEMLFMSALLAMASQVWQIEVGIWTMRLLLLRLMLGSGLVKAYGQDESWHTSYTAMNYHFLTTPLPNTWSRWVSLYAPDAMLKLMTVGTLVAEIHFPLATLLGIEWLNYGIFWAYVALQLSICTTGYYGFFNYLSMALSLSLLTDHTIITTLSWCQLPTWFLNDLRDFLKVVPGVSRSAVNHPSQTLMQLPSTWKMLSSSVSITFFLPLMLLVSITHYTAIVKLLQRTKWLAYPPNDSEESSPVSTSSTGSTEKMTSSPMALTCTTLEVATMVQETMAAIFYLGNHYGLFAHMTKERNEIIIQIAHSNRSTVHSKDEKDMKNVEWDILDFPFKPDDIFKPPKTVRPFFHMPRLDWMMWFQAFRPLPSYYQKWLWNFLISVLEQNEDVLSLLTEKTRKDLNRHWFYVQRMKEMQESKGNKDGTDKKSEDEGGRPQVKTSKKVVIEDQLQEADVYLRILFQKFEYYPKKQVAEKSSSGSTAASSATDVDNKEEEAGKKQYWSAKNLGVLLPPANLQDLYSLFDGQYSNRMNITKKKTGAPSVESAQDIILRTLFRNAEKRKQQQKEAEEASSHSSSLSQSDTSSTASGKKDL